jgi:hypothetical protein
LRSLNDPLFGWESYWNLPIPLIESVVKATVKQRENQVNIDNLAVSKLGLLVQSIAIQLYGTDNTKKSFKGDLLPHLAFPPEVKEEDIPGAIVPPVETIRIFFDLMKQGKIPPVVIANLDMLFPLWEKALKKAS